MKAIVLAAVALLFAACGTGGEEGSDVQDALPMAPTTTQPALPDGACVARMSNPNPDQGGTETVIIDSHFPSVSASIVVHYKSKDSNYSAQLDDKGHAEARFSIGHPTSNFVVNVDVNVNGQESCTTSFTPR
jgi:hypothetical protein